MSSWDHDGGGSDGRASDEAPDEQLDPTAPHPPHPPAEDGQPEQGEAGPEDISVVGVESLRWAPDRTAEAPPLLDLPDDPPTGEPSGGAPVSVSPWDPAAPALNSPGASDAPTDPTASVFAPGTALTPHAGPPGPPAPSHPGPPALPSPEKAGRPQIRPVILGLAALGALLILGLAVVALQGGGDDGSDAAGGSEVSPTDIDDLGEDSSLIVGTTGVVGMWSESEWKSRADGDQPGAGIELSVVGPGEVVTTAIGEVGDPVADSCASDGAADQDVRVPLEPGSPGAPPPVAVAGVDDPLPRPVEHLEGSETYQDAAAEVAEGEGEGATTPPTVTQVLRVDLDGTGTDEVVVAAEHLSDPDGLVPSPGDWSMVFLRRVAGNEVATDVLASSIADGDDGPLARVQVSAVADLNGDGVMEVVLSGRSAAGDWTAVHAAGEGGAAGGLSEVLRATCGQ